MLEYAESSRNPYTSLTQHSREPY